MTDNSQKVDTEVSELQQNLLRVIRQSGKGKCWSSMESL